MTDMIVKMCTRLSLLLLLVLGVVTSVLSCTGSQTSVALSGEPVSHSEVLCAVPSDAAVVMCFQNSRKGLEILTDPGACYSTLISGSTLFRRFVAALTDAGLLKSQHMAVSLHFSGTMEPLMAVDFGRFSADTSSTQRHIIELAETSRISSAIVRHGNSSLMLLSASETLIKSSVRHLSQGSSILMDEGFADIAHSTDARDALFFSNKYAGKLMSAFLAHRFQKHAPFVTGFADWTLLEIVDFSSRKVRMKGRVSCGESRSHYMHVLNGRFSGECSFLSVLPTGTWSAVSRSVNDLEAYYKAQTDYLDASSSLQKHQRACDTLKARNGMPPLRWAESLDIREVASARWKSDQGGQCSAVLFRTAKPRKNADAVAPFEWGDAVTLLFGNLFTPVEGAVSVTEGEWTVIGDENSVNDWLRSREEGGSLESSFSGLSVTLPQREAAFSFFFSVDAVAGRLENYFRPVLADDVEETLEGMAHEPIIMTYGKDGFNIEITRITASERATAVKLASGYGNVQDGLPAAPVPVWDPAGGDSSYFYQNRHLALCLKNKAGKGIWGIPFRTPISGRILNLDVSGKGRSQILFVAGTGLYVLERNGRFLSGYPVELGKELLAGPAVSGEPGDYRLMILHKDNTLGLYFADGRPVPEWKGITTDDAMTGLPEKKVLGEREVWVVRTSAKTLLFPENGGTPLYDRDDKKAIARDSEIEMTPKGAIAVTCVDGKKRKLKI